MASIFERIKADPRVDSVSDEGQDGLWVMLKPGFICADTGAHGLHERTPRDLWRSFKTVRPCDCGECKMVGKPMRAPISYSGNTHTWLRPVDTTHPIKLYKLRGIIEPQVGQQPTLFLLTFRERVELKAVTDFLTKAEDEYQATKAVATLLLHSIEPNTLLFKAIDYSWPKVPAAIESVF